MACTFSSQSLFIIQTLKWEKAANKRNDTLWKPRNRWHGSPLYSFSANWFYSCNIGDCEICYEGGYHCSNISGLGNTGNNIRIIPASHLHNLQQYRLSIPAATALPPQPWEEVIPDKVSETCGARHALPSSGHLGVQWPSRPADRTPLASGSAVWPWVCRRGTQTCDTRRSCSGQSSGNKPQGSPGEPLCPSDFHQLGNRWSCHLLLWQRTVLGRVARITTLLSLLFQVSLIKSFLRWVPRTQICSGKGEVCILGDLMGTWGPALSSCKMDIWLGEGWMALIRILLIMEYIFIWTQAMAQAGICTITSKLKAKSVHSLDWKCLAL